MHISLPRDRSGGQAVLPKGRIQVELTEFVCKGTNDIDVAEEFHISVEIDGKNVPLIHPDKYRGRACKILLPEQTWTLNLLRTFAESVKVRVEEYDFAVDDPILTAVIDRESYLKRITEEKVMIFWGTVRTALEIP